MSKRLGGVADDVNLRHAGQSLGDVDSRHVLDDPAKIAINEPAGEGQVVSEFVLVPARDFILELGAGSSGNRLQVGCSALECDIAAGDVVAGRQIRLLARAGISVKRSRDAGLIGQ